MKDKIEEIINQAEDCPNCDNVGFTVIQTSERQYVTRDMAMDACEPEREGEVYSEDAFEQEQCEFCYTNPKSRFNLATAIRKYIKQSIPSEEEIHTMIFKHTEVMLDNPDKYGIYPTGKFFKDLTKAIYERMR